jgi:hypothetical protein
MPHRKSIRYFFVPLAILALLFVTATFGGALHHHQNPTSENTCQICHFNHQPVERPPATSCAPVVAPVGALPELDGYEFSPSLLVRRLPSRAPPVA